MSDAVIDMRGVTRWFGREEVLAGADLTVERGSVTALLGRNGCGKSTLLRIAVGLLGRHGGEARVLGVDPEALGVGERLRMAYVNDVTATPGRTRIRDEIELHARLRGDRWDDGHAKELLERFEVPLDKRIGALSKGQQARLRLVLALASRPELLVLDEPALGLDLFARHELMELLIDLVQEEGRTVVIASHLIDDVERIADRLAFIREGRVTHAGTLDELRDRFRRVRVSVEAGGSAALDRAPSELIGVRQVKTDRAAPPDERVAILDDATDELIARLVDLPGVTRKIEVRRMTIREIYLEVLAGKEEEVTS